MLIGGTSEIGLAILALSACRHAEIILAGATSSGSRRGQGTPRLGAHRHYDALETASHQAFVDGVFADGPWTWLSPRPGCCCRRAT